MTVKHTTTINKSMCVTPWAFIRSQAEVWAVHPIRWKAYKL